jgi:hypothetical protein
VGDGIGADLFRDLDLALGDQRPGDRGAEQIEALRRARWRASSGRRIAHEFLAQIVDEDVLVLDAHQLGLRARAPAPRPGPDRR